MVQRRPHFAGTHRNEQSIAHGKKWLEKIFPIMEAELKKHTHLGADHPTLSDLAATTNLMCLEMCQYDLKPYPHIARWYDNMKTRPSFAKLAPTL